MGMGWSRTRFAIVKPIHNFSATSLRLFYQSYPSVFTYDRGRIDFRNSAMTVDVDETKTEEDSLQNMETLCMQGRLEKAVGILHRFEHTHSSYQVYYNAYACLLQACISIKDLFQGKKIHAHMIKISFTADTYIGNNLINMYAKCGSLVDARQVFDKMPLRSNCSWNTILDAYTKVRDMESAFHLFNKMPERDPVSWTVMIATHAQLGSWEEALGFYRGMLHEGKLPNNFTFTSVLNACTGLKAFGLGKQIHGHIIALGLDSYVAVSNSLISMYGKCENIEKAHQVFERMPLRNVYSWNALLAMYAQLGDMNSMQCFFDKMLERNIVSWNSMISGYAQIGYKREALELFVEMQQNGLKPDLITFTSILNTCANIEYLEQGKQVHNHLIRIGLELHGTVGTGLVNMYAKCGCMDESRSIFERMSDLNAVSWTAMIVGYLKCGSMNLARQLFDRMPEGDVVSWTAMIVGYAQFGNDKEAIELFEQMLLTGPKPNNFTFACVLSVFANLADLEKGKQIHAHATKVGFASHVSVTNSLITMYAKCGIIVDARQLFRYTPEQNAVSWTAIIIGNAQHGFGRESIQLFENMLQKGFKPDHVTFLGVLVGCSHSGLVDEGRHYFLSMGQDHGIIPRASHYACMIDLLGRAGCLKEAEDLINNMPTEPDAEMWGALLGSCRIHGNVDLARRAADNLFRLDPVNAGAYSLLANIYASSGRWDDVAKVRKMMRERGVKKEPGCSWIEIKNRVHVFGAEDASHPQKKEIYAMLEKLALLIREAGYAPNMKFVLHDINDEHKEQILCHHSEKLAIAFGLMNTPSGTPLRVIKNLRACGDCHTATKFISKVVGREIIVRDAIRFHHFKDGQCSCGDYW